MILEVIEQNDAAIALYESVGLHRSRRIVGYQREKSPGVREPIVEIDPAEFVRHMVIETEPGFPWQLAPETFAAMAAPTRAFSLEGRTFALATDTPSDRFVLWMAFAKRDSRRQGLTSRLIEGVVHEMGGKAVGTSVDVPDDCAPGFLLKNGFQEMSISQLEMSVTL